MLLVVSEDVVRKDYRGCFHPPFEAPP
jgi:hypothetical protein